MKKRILFLTGSVSRLAGGLFTSVRKLAQNLPSVDFETAVFGRRDRYTDEDMSAWNPVMTRAFNVLGPHSFGFCPALFRTVLEYSPNLIHLNGLWQYPSIVSLIMSRKKIPVMISPRGMLDEWAIKRSFLRKKIAMFLYEKHNISAASCVHVLTDGELNAVREYGYKGWTCIIPNGVDLPDFKRYSEGESKKILFMGRLHEKKGVDRLIEAWGIVGRQLGSAFKNWSLIIAGSGEPFFERKLRKMADAVQSKIHFAGFLTGTEKDKILREASAFVLPSFSEGMPMSVLEAWAYSLPVIITDKCNLRIGVEKGAAIYITPEIDSIARGLQQVMEMREAERIKIGLNGRKLVESEFSWHVVAMQMTSVYNWLITGSGEVPECMVQL